MIYKYISVLQDSSHQRVRLTIVRLWMHLSGGVYLPCAAHCMPNPTRPTTEPAYNLTDSEVIVRVIRILYGIKNNSRCFKPTAGFELVDLVTALPVEIHEYNINVVLKHFVWTLINVWYEYGWIFLWICIVTDWMSVEC